MTRRLRIAAMTFSVAASALLAQSAMAEWCYGTGGGGTGGACSEYTDQAACIAAVCQLSAGQGDPDCDPASQTCGTPAGGCSCTCVADYAACEAARAPDAEKFKPIILPNPLGISDPRAIAARGILAITGIAGSIALLMFVWGGFMWITSAGSPEKAKKAKGIFVNAVYGLMLIFGAYALINALLSAFAGAASS